MLIGLIYAVGRVCSQSFNSVRHCIVQGLKEEPSAEFKVICGNKTKEKRHHCDVRECVKLRNPRVAEEEWGVKMVAEEKSVT